MISDSDKIKNFIKEVHKKFGHPGVNKMYYTLMDLEVANLVEICYEINKICLKCQMNKNYIKYGKIKGRISGKKIFETVSSDIVGPYSCDDFIFKKEKEKFWLVTFTDTFSRYTIIKIVYNLKSETIAEKFEKYWMNKNPKPKIIITDQGRSYLGKAFKKILKDHDIEHILIKPYNPESNGISERINKEINFF